MQFPSDQDIIRLEVLKKYRDIYEGDTYRVFGIKDYFKDGSRQERDLYISVNYPSLISDYFSDMITADGVLVSADTPEVQEALNNIVNRNDLDSKIFQASLSQSIYGYSVIRAINDNGEAKIQVVPVDQYFPTFTPSLDNTIDDVCIASYMTIEDEKGKDMEIILKQIYSTDDSGTVLIRYEAWTVDFQGKAKDQIPVSQVNPNLPTGEVALETSEIPVYQINNVKLSDEKYGKSDYKDIEPQIEEINNRVTQISVQLIKHMNARIAVAEGTLDEHGQVRASEADMIEVGEGTVAPSYITNSNPQIDQGFLQIDKLSRQMASISKVPTDVLGQEGKGGAEKVEAMRIRLFNTLRSVSRKRIMFNNALEGILRSSLEIEGIEYDGNITITWTNPLPPDTLTETEVLAGQLDSGLKSQRKAVGEIQNISGEELDQELQEIQKDNAPSIPLFANNLDVSSAVVTTSDLES
jgi:hypothetical protein